MKRQTKAGYQLLGFSISQFLSFSILLALPQEGPITRDGRYWVQTVEGTTQAPGLMRLRVNSVGGITVRGDAGSQIRYSARKRSEEHTSELQSLAYLVCRLLLEKKK